MIDEKIPVELRSRVPIVCDGDGIVWVPGLGAADRYMGIIYPEYSCALDYIPPEALVFIDQPGRTAKLSELHVLGGHFF